MFVSLDSSYISLRYVIFTISRRTISTDDIGILVRILYSVKTEQLYFKAEYMILTGGEEEWIRAIIRKPDGVLTAIRIDNIYYWCGVI